MPSDPGAMAPTGDLASQLSAAQSALRDVEHDRDVRVAAAKRQLTEAKRAAKEMFAGREARHKAAIAEIKEAGRVREKENVDLKNMLRASDAKAEEAEVRAQDACEKLGRVEEELRAAVDDAVAGVVKERDAARAVVVEKDVELERVGSLVEVKEREIEDIVGEREGVRKRVAELKGRLKEVAEGSAGVAAVVLERDEALAAVKENEVLLERTKSLVVDTEKEKAEVESALELERASMKQTMSDLEAKLGDAMVKVEAGAGFAAERDEARTAVAEKEALLERSISQVQESEKEKADISSALEAERERSKQIIADLEGRLEDAISSSAAAATAVGERDTALESVSKKEAQLVRAHSWAEDADKEEKELGIALEVERELAQKRILELENKLADATSSANANSEQNDGKPNGVSPTSGGSGEKDLEKESVVPLRKSLDDALKRIADLHQSEKEQGGQMQKAKEEMETQRLRISELESALEEANERIRAFEARVESYDEVAVAELKNALQKSKAQTSALEGTIIDIESSSTEVSKSLEAEREAAVLLRAELDSSVERVASLESNFAEKSSQCEATCTALEKLKSTAMSDESASALQSELEAARVRIASLESEAATVASEASASGVTEEGTSTLKEPECGQPSAGAEKPFDVERKAVAARIEELESELAAARSEKVPVALLDGSDSIAAESTGKSAEYLSGSEASELRSKEQEAREALAAAKSVLGALESSNKKLVVELSSTKAALADAEASLATQIELAANAAPISKVVESAKSAESSNQSTGGSADVKVLQAKVAELERLLTAKQAETVKVREKARAYLKDMNAEKREMETKLKAELAESGKKLKGEKERFSEAEKDSEGIAQEIDSCLRVISEKQKAIQALNMTISNERAATVDAQAQLSSLISEFDEYKERARLALAERDASIASASTGVESATDDLSKRMEKAEAEAAEFRLLVSAAKAEIGNLIKVEERAARAEAALDLVKSDATVLSSSNFSRIDTLEDELDTTRKELASAESAVQNLEARLSTTVLRLEVAERALRSAELDAEDASRTAGNTVLHLQNQVKSLQESVGHANESAAAAQRTAAVAARAMAYTHLEDEAPPPPSSSPPPPVGGFVRESPSFQSERASVSSYTSGGVHMSLPEPFSPAAIFSPGLQPGRRGGALSTLRGFLNENPVVGELSAKDDQIAVLMSQISELGVLLEDSREESTLREQQVELLKVEVAELSKKLAAADKLKDGTPFGLLRTTVVHFMRTGDAALLPVLGTVLGVSEDEMKKVKAARAVALQSTASTVANGAAGYLPSFMSSS